MGKLLKNCLRIQFVSRDVIYNKIAVHGCSDLEDDIKICLFNLLNASTNVSAYLPALPPHLRCDVTECLRMTVSSSTNMTVLSCVQSSSGDLRIVNTPIVQQPRTLHVIGKVFDLGSRIFIYEYHKSVHWLYSTWDLKTWKKYRMQRQMLDVIPVGDGSRLQVIEKDDHNCVTLTTVPDIEAWQRETTPRHATMSPADSVFKSARCGKYCMLDITAIYVVRLNMLLQHSDELQNLQAQDVTQKMKGDESPNRDESQMIKRKATLSLAHLKATGRPILQPP